MGIVDDVNGAVAAVSLLNDDPVVQELMEGRAGPVVEDDGVGHLAGDVARWRGRLGVVRPGPDGTVAGLSEAEHLELLRTLEDLKAATGAAQAVVTASFDQARRNRKEAEGVPAAGRGRG